MSKKTVLISVTLAATTKIGKEFKFAGDTVEVTENQKAELIKKGIVKDESAPVVSKGNDEELKAKITSLESDLEAEKAKVYSLESNDSAATIAELEAKIETLKGFIEVGKDTQKGHYPAGWPGYLAAELGDNLLGKQE